MSASFLWYDLETWGRDASKTRISQFAAIRTDEDLQPIGEPISIFCKPAGDLLPSPTACVITGLTPQNIPQNAPNEAEFFALINEQMSQSGTCCVGYNSLRFDDEFIRYGLYRNFYPAYDREWRNGNSRWDLLDVMRMAEALRPDGIQWPQREDGLPSFKLEDLAQANGARRGDAHEALSDVRALIALARLLKKYQPKLWDYALGLRDKKKVMALINPISAMPLLHISGKYPASQHCAALVLPITRHPQYDNRSIVIDLCEDPDRIAGLSAAEIEDLLFTPRADLPEHVQRVSIKEIHSNKCPILIPMQHVQPNEWQRLGLDPEIATQRAAEFRSQADLAEKLRLVFSRPPMTAKRDADAALYQGFVPDVDQRHFNVIRGASPDYLRDLQSKWQDPRMPELLFRYRARNWPENLSRSELAQWNAYRNERLTGSGELSEYNFDSYAKEIHALRQAHEGDGKVQAMMDQLQQWSDMIKAEL